MTGEALDRLDLQVDAHVPALALLVYGRESSPAFLDAPTKRVFCLVRNEEQAIVRIIAEFFQVLHGRTTLQHATRCHDDARIPINHVVPGILAVYLVKALAQEWIMALMEDLFPQFLGKIFGMRCMDGSSF